MSASASKGLGLGESDAGDRSVSEGEPFGLAIGRIIDRVDVVEQRIVDLNSLFDNLVDIVEKHRISLQSVEALQIPQASFEQVVGQVRALEQTSVQIQHAIMTLGQRQDLLARNQAISTFRTQALEAAVKSKGPGEQPDGVVKYAKAYFEFLMEDVRTAEAAQRRAAEMALQQSPTAVAESPQANNLDEDQALAAEAAAGFKRVH